MLFASEMLFANTKSGSKLSEVLEKLSGLGPGEVEGTLRVGVKSVNPKRTTCGELFSKEQMKF